MSAGHIGRHAVYIGIKIKNILGSWLERALWIVDTVQRINGWDLWLRVPEVDLVREDRIRNRNTDLSMLV